MHSLTGASNFDWLMTEINRIEIMELAEFIEAALVQIHKGLRAANKTVRPDYPAGSPDFNRFTIQQHSSMIHFDVAVTVSNEVRSGATGNAGGGIKVMGVGELGGKIEGKVEQSSVESTISHIKFAVRPERGIY